MALAVHARALRVATEPQHLGYLAELAVQRQLGDEQPIGPQHAAEHARLAQRVDGHQPVDHVA